MSANKDVNQDILEHDLAHRWQSLPFAQILPLTSGETCSMLYAGRPGGPQGPDMRDAVLQFTSEPVSERDARITGDVEFHIRCSDWYTHRHHTDERYNKVILHVVLIFDSAGPILRQDGQAVPVCSLNDLVPSIFPQPLWPCQCIMPSLSAEEGMALLQRAGLLRFEQKTQALLVQLSASRSRPPFSAYDVCLIPALVEALGYGRDRAFFRAIGLRLVGLASEIPEPAGHAATPAPLDAGRLRASGKLVEQWRVTGAWETIRRAIFNVDGDERDTDRSHCKGGGGVEMGGDPCGRPRPSTDGLVLDGRPRPSTDRLTDKHVANTVSGLRALFPDLSTARADILICNVILPFAAAIAHIEQDDALLSQARKIYTTFPRLASNQVTRSMYRQLGLQGEPKDACQQQGLHYIYAQTCREKQCDTCIVVRREA